MGKAIKKPVKIEFVRWWGTNEHEIVEFMGGSTDVLPPCEGEHYILAETLRGKMVPIIKTLEGKLSVSVGDYIIKGVKGEFYPCKPDIFEMTYEVVE